MSDPERSSCLACPRYKNKTKSFLPSCENGFPSKNSSRHVLKAFIRRVLQRQVLQI
jgi:hypothetical protein